MIRPPVYKTLEHPIQDNRFPIKKEMLTQIMRVIISDAIVSGTRPLDSYRKMFHFRFEENSVIVQNNHVLSATEDIFIASLTPP